MRPLIRGHNRSLVDFHRLQMSTTNKLLIIVATYNEMENLPSLIAKLFEVLPEASIVVVDDDSPDGTGKWCEQEAEKRDNLVLISRSGKLGLGSASIAGFEFGIENNFDYIATMDADWSHDPASMKELWEIVQRCSGVGQSDNFGAIIGSRYVEGGEIKGWPRKRLLSSKFVNWFTRLLLRVPTKDNTGAFRIYSAEALDVVDVRKINCQGYGYLEELIFLLHKNEFELHEHPITFTDRDKGESKASVWEGIKVLASIVRLAFR